MYSNFDVVKQMRETILFEDMDFETYLESYESPFERNHMKKLWKRANSLLNDEEWKVYLCNRMANALGMFSKAINDLYEEGYSEDEIASFGIDVRTVTSFLW